MTSTRICFVRHGETDWNAQKRMQGHIDIPLNATGIIQAKRLAKSLEQSNHRFDQIYASDLERAKHTAQVVADSYGIKVKTLVDLRERHVGKLQGLLLAEAPTLVPHIWQRHLVRELDYDLEGGESIVQFHKRMHLALEHLHAEHRGCEGPRGERADRGLAHHVGVERHPVVEVACGHCVGTGGEPLNRRDNGQTNVTRREHGEQRQQ